MEASERVYIPYRTVGWHLVLPVALFEAGNSSKTDKMAFHSRSKVTEQRQELFANSIPEKSRVVVRGVLPPFEALPRKILADSLPRYAQERTDNSGPGFGEDTPETGRSSAAEEPEQDSFGLIGGGVAGRDPVDEASVAPLGKVPEAGLTAILLQVPHYRTSRRHVTGQITGQAPDESFVGVGGGTAQAVVDVQDNQWPVMDRTQSVEEENAVSATGNSYAERTTRHSKPVQRRCDRFEHVSR